MSLKNAKVYKSGILIDEKLRKTLIVPFEILISPSYNRNYKFQNSINQQLYHLFFPHAKKYTIFFDRSNLKKPQIYIYAYFSAQTLPSLQKNAKQSMIRLKNFLTNNGLLLKIIESQIIHQEILGKIPININETKPKIFEIVTSNKTSYLTLAKLFFAPDQEKNDLVILLRDFYAISNFGCIILDLNYNPKKDKGSNEILASILIKLESNDLDEITKNQKKIESLLSIFSQREKNDDVVNFWFLRKDELKENYGKIILGQGWKPFLINSSYLDFASFFNLLVDKH